MIKAAGCIFLSKKTKRILLNLRSNEVSKPNCFGFWGGKLEQDENILEGLSREIVEEVGFLPKHERIIVIDQYESPDNQFQYTSFVVIVEDEFVPKTNSESSGYCWCSVGCFPKPLHPGAKTILSNKTFIQSLKNLL